MVTVIEKPSTFPGVVRFEANRVLTGQGHERFTSAAQAVGPRPAAELARRLFATDRVDGVSMFSNMITVDLKHGHQADGMGDIIHELYRYWKPGMEPTVFVEEVPAEAGGAVSDGGDAAGAGGGSEYERRVPAVLIERSRAAMAKWKASH